MNEVIFRVTEIDDQGLRALAEASTADELPANRADGPGGLPAGRAPRDLSRASPRCSGTAVARALVDLVATDRRHRRTARRRRRGGRARPWPRCPTRSPRRSTIPTPSPRPRQAVVALKVLLATEVASELGVTIGFSDTDGDS